RIGYFVPEFPSQTHTFFWREICDLRALGVNVTIFSTKQPARQACPHAFAEAARAEAHYLFPPRIFLALAYLIQHPFRLLQALKYIISLRQSPFREKMKVLALLVCASDLCCMCRSMSIA